MRLRSAMALDAIITGANGLAYLVLAGPLGDLFGLDPALLRGVGAFLLAFSVLVWRVGVGGGSPSSRGAVLGVVFVNASWAVASLVAAIAGFFDPATFGTVWIIAQALVVGGFAELQLAGLGKERPARRLDARPTSTA